MKKKMVNKLICVLYIMKIYNLNKLEDYCVKEIIWYCIVINENIWKKC